MVDSDEIALAPTALDTSVLVAGLLTWHERHRAASAMLASLLESRARIILPLHALAEAYSVMTRLPPPHRLGPRDALQVLERSLKPRSTLVGLDGEEDGNASGIWSGPPSWEEPLTMASSWPLHEKGGAVRIITLNPAHFERLGSEIEIAVP